MVKIRCNIRAEFCREIVLNQWESKLNKKSYEEIFATKKSYDLEYTVVINIQC